VDIVLADLEQLASTKSSHHAKGKLGFSPGSKAFADYFARVQTRRRSAHRARNQFVKANLGLVVSVARRYQRGGLPLADLIQEGNLGLIKAVSRFDHRRGFRFSTYATWWIRHAIGRALADKGRTVRVPVHVLEAKQRIRKTTAQLASKLGRDPTREELARELELDADKLEKTMSYGSGHALSLDEQMGNDGDRERIEIFRKPEDEGPTAYDVLANQSLLEHVTDLIHELSPMEADVLRRRFGLDGHSETTLQEIANGYSLSRERIRQIQEKALSKVRRNLRRNRAI
jgi:RNA polymerase primary sigma factor